MNTIQPTQVKRIDNDNVLMCSDCGEEFKNPRTSVVTVCPKCRNGVKSVREILKPSAGDVFKTCVDCGTGFTIPAIWGVAAQFSTKCPTCVEKLVKTETAMDVAHCIDKAEHLKRKRKFEEMYPFETWTVPDKLPNPRMLQNILSLDQSKRRGVFLHGPSRQGKSRCIWALAEREFMAGRTFAFVDGGFGLKYAAMFSKDATWVEKWIKDLISVDILLLDDVFKVKMTDSLEGTLFYVIDKRLENDRVTWWTTNDTPQTLASRLGADRGPALVERIKETCDAIAFTRKS
jgi:DNA replication protein DnaC